MIRCIDVLWHSSANTSWPKLSSHSCFPRDKYLVSLFSALGLQRVCRLTGSWNMASALAMAFLLTSPVLVSLPVVVGSTTAALPGMPLRGFRPLGPAPDSLPILVTLGLPLRNTALLDSMVMQVSDPSSPMYRHFLSSQQVKADFLPTAEFNSLTDLLRSQGFTLELTALDSEVVVQGTAGQFRNAFGGSIDTYTNGTATYYSSVGAPTFQGAYLYSSNATFLFAKPAAASLAPHVGTNVTFTSGTFSAKDLQPVYNATYYYARGIDGAGQTIGLLDYYGSPTVGTDLRLFDSTFGIKDSTLKITPVGPYDPGLGVSVGWSTEVALDVEASHSMAPGAAVDLYVANGAVPLSVPLAKIVEDDSVTTLSQSFGYYEWFYSQSSEFGGPAFFGLYAMLPDQYYALGSLEGISFLASSGDGGGSGYSSGPEGNLEYPATSPFVTSVGGTQTYFAQNSTGGKDFTQTAWSNIGFVPNLVNNGGGGGGVSILEPKPWYQSDQATPPSYPNGRLNPDLSLQAGVDPATEIVDAGNVVGTGGTSESSPLFAGLLTLMAQSNGGGLGLVNPFLYKVGNDPAKYTKGYEPITFGYIIPWRASFGYNLATGWGAPNIGELGVILNATKAHPELRIDGEISNSTGGDQVDFTARQNITVNALVSRGGTHVTEGLFTIELQTLRGTTAPVTMAYDAATGNWTGAITVGQQAGIAYVFMRGTSGGVSGQAMGSVFTGYLGSLTVTGSVYFLPVDPWSWTPNNTLSMTVFTSDLSGNPEPSGGVKMAIEPYSISSNTYSNSSVVTFTGSGSGAVTGYLSTPAPAGPLSMVTLGSTYGYAPTVYGIYMQDGYIYPDVAAEPGAAAPGQSLTIIANPIAPVNVYFETSLETGRTFAYDVFVGSNVTADLLNPSGKVVSTAPLLYQPCDQALRVCNGGADAIYGQLEVPTGSAEGLYTVMLHASYTSYTPGGNLTGTFYGQVWVSSPAIRPGVLVMPGYVSANTSSPLGDKAGSLYEGEKAHILVSIDYANGTGVRFGVYTAVLYPKSLSDKYTSLMHTQYASGNLIPLTFDPNAGVWLGNLTLPSSASQGSIAGLGINTFDYSGPFEVYVTGMSADAVPTTAELSAQAPFQVQPFLYVDGGTLPPLAQSSGLALSGVTIDSGRSLSGDIFLGTSTIDSAKVTISNSLIEGTLVLRDANVSLLGVTGGDVMANGSVLTLKDTSLGSLALSKSNVTLTDSSYQTVIPAPPSIQVVGLSTPVGGIAKYNITVSGAGLGAGSLQAWVDGIVAPLTVTTSSSGLFAVGQVDASSLNDGVHTLTLKASQSDGLSTSTSAAFSTNAHQLALQKQSSTLFDIAYALAALAVAGLAIGLVALRLGRTKPP
jgi:subtilase family serine protease